MSYLQHKELVVCWWVCDTGVLFLFPHAAGELCGQRYGGTPLIGAARDGDIHAIRVLIEAGADPNERGGVNGWPPSDACHPQESDEFR